MSDFQAYMIETQQEEYKKLTEIISPLFKEPMFFECARDLFGVECGSCCEDIFTPYYMNAFNTIMCPNCYAQYSNTLITDIIRNIRKIKIC